MIKKLKQWLSRFWPASKKQLADGRRDILKKLKEFRALFIEKIGKIEKGQKEQNDLLLTAQDSVQRQERRLKELLKRQEQISVALEALQTNQEKLWQLSLEQMQCHEKQNWDWRQSLTAALESLRRLEELGAELGQDSAKEFAEIRQDLTKELTSIQERLDAEQKSTEIIRRDLATLSEQTGKGLSSKVDAMYQRHLKTLYPMDIRFDRGYYKDFFLLPSEEFKDKFLALVKDLDEKSIEAVALALRRLKSIQSAPPQKTMMGLYSAEERQEKESMIDRFRGEVLPLSVNCFYYNGYLLPINHFDSSVFWNKCGIPHLEHPERFADKDIIDAGAYIGDSALIFSPLTQRKVYAFEPTPSNYELLLKTIELNGIENVVPCPYALGEQAGTISISISDSCSGQFRNEAVNYEGTVDVEEITLDSFVRKHDLHVGLIKTDVEGAEQLMLRGAMETIKTQRPALLISIYHNADDFFHIKPMLEALDLGYQFKIRKPLGGSVLSETMLICEVEDNGENKR